MQPKSILEKQITSLLNTAHLADATTQQQAETKALAALSLTPEEQAARLAAVRQSRELMFRAERKAKRVAKIKSKAFRRIARKKSAADAGKDQLTVEEMEQLDELDGGDRAEVERERMEVNRARERAGLRHSVGKQGGRWSQEVRGLYGLDEDEAKRDERERVQREEQLRRRVLGKDLDGTDEDESDDDQDEDDDMDVDGIKQNAFDELQAFEREEALANAAAKPSGLMGMKFMQTAIARDQAKADALADSFRKEMETAVNSDGDAEMPGLDDAEVGVVGDQVDSNPGRMAFAPSQQVNSLTYTLITLPDMYRF